MNIFKDKIENTETKKIQINKKKEEIVTNSKTKKFDARKKIFFKKKIYIQASDINPFNIKLLKIFLSKNGLILPRSFFKIKKKLYSKVVRTIKFCRIIYILPFYVD